MKNTLFILLLLSSFLSYAQLTDDFSDGNFTLNPVWNGSNSGADFMVNGNRLRSNSTLASGNFYISTNNSQALNCRWEFWVNLQFSTSGANYTDIYLISDKADLKSSLINGYFVRLGNTDDEISLYKRSGSSGSSIKIIDGVNGSIATASNTIKIRVSRSNSGLFTLEREIAGSNSTFFTEGTFLDLSYTNSSFFGIYIQQSTSSFFQKHFFDDFKIETLITDTIAPQLSTVAVIDSITLEATFSEAMDSLSIKNNNNFNIYNFPGQVAQVYTTDDPAKFRLRLSVPVNTGNYSLTVINSKDKSGNIITNSNTAAFIYTKPYIVKFRDIMINEIFPDPNPQVDLPSVEYVELINTTSENILLNNWKFSDASSTATLGNTNIAPNSFLILCAKADTAEFKIFGKVLGLSPWPGLNNGGEPIKLKNSVNTLIDSLAYSDIWYRDAVKKQGGWSLERIDPRSVCSGIFNWVASKDPSGGTPGKQNSAYIENYDQLTLLADSISRPSDSTLLIYFNKPLDSASILKENFSLLPASGQIKKLSPGFDLKLVSLTFSEKFTPGKTYTFSISGLKDCSGNPAGRSSGPFSFSIPGLPPLKPEKVDTARIFISEVFPDPSPEVGLPLAEFIEIYNPGPDTLDLEGWSINDPQTKSMLKKLLLPPQQYLILCPAADTAQYKSVGRTLVIAPWPSLNNSSDQLILKSFKNRTVDSISYTDMWYRDAVKKQGGWSLERIDYRSKCLGVFNWAASKDPSGGTPGKQNSAYIENYDQLTLLADSISRPSDSTLIIYFNKPLDSASIRNENFSLLPASGQIKKLSPGFDLKLVNLTFSEKFIPGKTYTLSLSGLKDCSGNPEGSSSGPFSFSIPGLPPLKPEKVDTARIFISEVFPDPSPEVGLPLAEFVEIYNPGPDTLDLDGWSINDPQTKSMLKKLLLPPQQYLILCPAADTAQYKSFGRTLGIAPWPSLNNSSDQLILKSFKNRTVDSISYSDTWYKDAQKKSGGWSLEKTDLSKNTCQDFYNWTASISTSGGTPGKRNSLDQPGNMYAPLKIDSINLISDNTIAVYFNRIPDTLFLKSSNFSINNGIGKARTSLISQGYKGVILDFNSKFQEGQKYMVSADSLISCAGLRTFSPDNQASFTIPLIPEINYPILINEIFADPSPPYGLPESEFVELFNPTENTVNIKGLGFGDQSSNFTFPSEEIAAGAYLILCQASDTSAFKKFGKVRGLPSWPGLNNDSDILILKNNKGRELQRLSYEASWYKDAEKRKGGYTLELIDPASICAGSQNWTSSRDSSGGTPGRMNSVYQANAPTEPLKLIEAVLIDSITISLGFNRNIDSLKAEASSNFDLNNGIGHPEYSYTQSPDFDKVILKFREPLARGHTYRITLNKLTDCRNIPIAAEFNSLEFILTLKIGKNDILLTEILFNPRPDGADFVEIYNNTDHLLDLKELFLARIIKDTINSIQQLSDKQLLLEPMHYLALSPNPDNIKKEYHTENPASLLKVFPFPPFNDDSGTAVLISEDKKIDQLSYHEKMHFPLLKNVKGVSLERSSLNRPANDPGNLRSATSASGFASPGSRNSQYSDDKTSNEEFSLASKTFSPDNDGFEDILQVSYRFPNPGKIANVSIFNDQGLLIKKLLKNFTLNSEGVFIWDGFNDQNQLASTGIYIIHAEIFDTEGEIKKYRRTCVLAVKFN